MAQGLAPVALGAEGSGREIEFAVRLQHPHICTVFDSGEVAGELWFTMPYVEGESLRDGNARSARRGAPDTRIRCLG